MRRVVLFFVCLFALCQVIECGVRRKRQSVPQIPQIANGELITSIFQIPITTLGAVRDLLQTTRGRFQAIGQAYQALQAAHPNHRPNPHFTYDRFTSNGQKYPYQSNSYQPKPNQNNPYQHRPNQNYPYQQRPNQNYPYQQRPNQNKYYSSAHSSAQSFSYSSQDYNRKRIHNSKALVQPRNNALSDEDTT